MPFSFNQKPNKKLHLDPFFVPLALANKEYLSAVNNSENPTTVLLAIERSNGFISTFNTSVFGEESQADANFIFIERLVKTLVWIKGGWKVYYCGPKDLGLRLQIAYIKNGIRDFDSEFMSSIYGESFEVVIVGIDEFPKPFESSTPVGRHLDGYRIGFDAGGSDRKVSAVVNGKAIFSEEVIWHPKLQSNPEYHYQEILSSMKKAASYLPKVDAIGVSAAGIYIDNQVRAASLFIKVPKTEFESKVKNMFLDIAHEMGDVPIEVANDGDVTALAGAMSLGTNKVLGIAMGTSQAAGYVDEAGNITGWLNELAFVPVDYNLMSAIDDWSKDYGCGVNYFSQDAVIRLAKNAEIEIDETLTPAEKLSNIQNLLEEGNPKAKEIFDTIGVYLGYSIAYYSQFYDIDTVLILGRVSSKTAGTRILKLAKSILKDEFPIISQKIRLILPDEKSRRVGQSIAAASLPMIRKVD